MSFRRSASLLLLSTLAAALAVPATAQEGASTAGRGVAKRFAALGKLPDPAMIVVEDIMNYHRHQIPLPKAGAEVALDLRWDTPLPAHTNQSVLQIGIATARVHDRRSLRPLNLALVIDRSGSMADQDKMACVKAGLERFVRKLRADDRISIVGYADRAAVILPSQRVGDRRRVLEAVRCLTPGGATNLHSGLMLGYEEVAKYCEEDADHRVILLTDGRANEGVTDAEQIAAESKRYNKRGIDLSTIGVGSDFNHGLLSQLAKTGRGLFHFVSDREDIEKVFVQEAQSLIGIVARDVTLDVRHGPGVEVMQIYGYRPHKRADGFSVKLENFNAGLTSVVIVRLRRTGTESRATPIGRVQARLTYESARTGRRETLTERTRCLHPSSSKNSTDHEVRKNFTIAVLARATRRLAEAARSSRYGEAERIASRALEFYRGHYKGTDDKDLTHNSKVLRQYRGIVAQHIERFRRL